MFVINFHFANGAHLRMFLQTFMFAHTRYISVHTVITTSDVTLRWQTSMETLCLMKPSSGRSSIES